MNQNEKDRIAAAINQLRPDWPTRSVRTMLDDPQVSDRPRRDVVVALSWIAAEADSRTPKRVFEAGPWWRATAAESAPEERRWAPPKNHQACGEHPGEWRDRCRSCRADEIARPDPPLPPINPRVAERMAAVAEARKVMDSKRAELCRHGASVCTECDAARAAGSVDTTPDTKEQT